MFKSVTDALVLLLFSCALSIQSHCHEAENSLHLWSYLQLSKLQNGGLSSSCRSYNIYHSLINRKFLYFIIKQSRPYLIEECFIKKDFKTWIINSESIIYIYQLLMSLMSKDSLYATISNANCKVEENKTVSSTITFHFFCLEGHETPTCLWKTSL